MKPKPKTAIVTLPPLFDLCQRHMNSLELFELLPPFSGIDRDTFSSIYEKAANTVGVMSTRDILTYSVATELDRASYFDDAGALFRHSSLVGLEFVQNMYHQAMLLERSGRLAEASQGFSTCLDFAARLRLRDKDAPNFTTPSKYRAFPEITYRNLDALHHLERPDNNEVQLSTLEMKAHYFLGRIAEYQDRLEEALSNYDKCMSISTALAYWGGKQLEHRDVKRSLLRLLETRSLDKDYDVLLVSVNPTASDAIFTYSGALLVLGTYLAEHGKTVKLLNSPQEDEILAFARRSRYIGFSVMTAQIPASLRISRKIKALFPDRIIIWGGAHPTLYPDQTLDEPAIDFVVAGPGEEALNQLIDHLNHGESVDAIPCLGHKLLERRAINPQVPFDFSRMGRYRFDLMAIHDYLDHQMGAIPLPYPAFAYYASKGCPMGCTFCINSTTESFSKRQPKSLEVILDDIALLIESARIRCIFFYDEYFFGSRSWFSRFLDAFEQRDFQITWGGSFHVHNILKHRDLILRAQSLGLRYINCSVESGSDRILKLLNKHATVDDILEVFEFLSEANMITLSSFITHLPTETPEEIEQTFELRDKLREMFRRKNVPSYLNGPQPFRPYPGTALYEHYIRGRWREPDSLEAWSSFVTQAGNLPIIEDMFWLGESARQSPGALLDGGNDH